MSALLVLLFGVGAWYYLDSITTPRPFDISEFYSTLEVENSAFANAEKLRISGQNPEQALALYKTALNQINDTSEEAQVKLLIAITTDESGKYQEAVALYKEIVGNIAYPLRIRAFAVQQMGVLLSGAARTKVWDLVFSGEPYTTLIAGEDGPLTIRHLYEYASSIYPLAFSEIMIADWYAGKLAEQKMSISISTPPLTQQEVAAYTDVVRTKLASADQDIARMEQSPLGESNIPLALLRRAVVVSKMSLAADQAFGDPNEAFLRAEKAYTDREWSSGYVFFGHAAFEALLYGNARPEEISVILAPILNKTIRDYDEFKVYLRDLRFLRTPGLTGKLYATLLGKTNSDFKKLLISLGWTEMDFK